MGLPDNQVGVQGHPAGKGTPEQMLAHPSFPITEQGILLNLAT